MRRLLLIPALLALSFAAHAQTTCAVGVKGVAPTANISFVAPTLNTDGTAVAEPVTYNIYQSTTSGAEVKVASGQKGEPITVNTGITSNATFYWKVTAVDANGNEGVLSNEACKTFPASVPAAVTITVT